nr:DEAD/DEAH box helicase [Amycolatopsis antarctica]
MTFRPADPPRAGAVLVLHTGDGEPLEVAVPQRRTVTATHLTVADAIGPLAATGRDAHPAAAFWGAATRFALRFLARGLLVPGLTPGGVDVWRPGPFDADDAEAIRALAAAMPPEARAVPLPGDGPPRLHDAHTLLRAYLDAVTDAFPRSPAAALATGQKPYAATESQRVPELRDWAAEVGGGLDAGVGVSLRMEISPAGTEHRAVVQVHSLADPTLVLDARDLWADAGPGFGPAERIESMLALRRAARSWPPLERLLHNAVPDVLEVDDADLADLLGGGAVRLATAGVRVHWPKEMLRELTAKAVLRAGDAARSDIPGLLGTDGLLEFDWQLALAGDPLTAEEMDRLAEAHRPVVRLRDRWVLVEPELAARARERSLEPLSPADALGAALTGSAEIGGKRVEVAASGWLDDLRARITDPESGHEDIPAPAGLDATLRDYQLRGFRWLAGMTSLGLGACLADDMGLGKTVTLIALHLQRGGGPTLVVCPASLLGNWEREIRRFAPGTAVRRFHGTARNLDDVTDGFVLTTYGTMRLDAARLDGVTWNLLVADEAQHVKNPGSGTAKALRAIGSGARVALTGTPVENNLSELWAILDWTTPGLLGKLSRFRTRWATPIETGDRDSADRLARLVRPFLLRRKKSDPGIAPELPPKTETDRPVGLTGEQAGLYEAVVREAMAEIRSREGMARMGSVVKLLTSLKQICNHPAQYLKETGDPRLPGRSGKLELLDELLDTILTEDGSVLVFTQYVAMARLLERHLAGRGVPALFLHGGTPVPKREELVRRFQNGEVPVFLLSLKAAGTGLNLTRADHVVHFDRWWNPAVEEQATDRAYRIGQNRPVQVHRLIAEGTIEDRIAAMLRTKRDLAEAVLGSGETALTELSDAELAELVELRGNR